MENPKDKYETVIGLEVHIQLLTRSKVFSSDKNEFGGSPNTHVSVVSLGHPGTLPVFNKKVLEQAVKLGIACNCTIAGNIEFSRKNYFYADLPKGYQITQFHIPVCKGGFIGIYSPNTDFKKSIRLTQIHIEEDAGKGIHDLHPESSMIDLNRAGVPLLEMVTEPELRSAEEACRLLSEIRKLVRYLEICDGNLEEGSMRCDANISVMKKGSLKFGNKVEIKNMNSFRNVQRAIQYEIKRQVDILENSENIIQETRGFNDDDGTTYSLRNKESAHDYRYFPDPDLLPFYISKEYIDEIKKNLPPLPHQLIGKYVKEFGLSASDALAITEDKNLALFFEKLVEELEKKMVLAGSMAKQNLFKTAGNWMMGTVKSFLNENSLPVSGLKISPANLAGLILLIEEGTLSHSMASQKIFRMMHLSPQTSPLEIAEKNNLIQQSDASSLKEFVKQAISKYPEKVKEYKAGKKGLVGLFMGEVMKLSNGKADPKVANQLVKEMLEEK